MFVVEVLVTADVLLLMLPELMEVAVALTGLTTVVLAEGSAAGAMLLVTMGVEIEAAATVAVGVGIDAEFGLLLELVELAET